MTIFREWSIFNTSLLLSASFNYDIIANSHAAEQYTKGQMHQEQYVAWVQKTYC